MIEQAINPDGPMFYMIFAARAGYDDFQVEGVFSKKEDADDFKALLEAQPYIQCVSNPQYVPLKTIMDELVKDRLGKLAGPLQTIASRMEAQTEEDGHWQG